MKSKKKQKKELPKKIPSRVIMSENISLETFVSQYNFGANTVILYRKGENPYDGKFDKVTSYCKYFMVLLDGTVTYSPTSIEQRLSLLISFLLKRNSDSLLKDLTSDVFLQTPIILFTDDSGRIFHLLVIKNGQCISDIVKKSIGHPHTLPIKPENMRPAIYNAVRDILKESLSINLDKNPNWIILDKTYNSQIQEKALREKEIKESKRKAKERAKQIAWDKKLNKIKAEKNARFLNINVMDNPAHTNF